MIYLITKGQFYGCANWSPLGSGCKFFQWADPQSDTQSSSTTPQQSRILEKFPNSNLVNQSQHSLSPQTPTPTRQTSVTIGITQIPTPKPTPFTKSPRQLFYKTEVLEAESNTTDIQKTLFSVFDLDQTEREMSSSPLIEADVPLNDPSSPTEYMIKNKRKRARLEYEFANRDNQEELLSARPNLHDSWQNVQSNAVDGCSFSDVIKYLSKMHRENMQLKKQNLELKRQYESQLEAVEQRHRSEITQLYERFANK